MRLSLVAGERPAKSTTVLIQELEEAGVHVPGISPPPTQSVRRLRLVTETIGATRQAGGAV